MQVGDKVYIKSDTSKVQYWIYMIVHGNALLRYKNGSKDKIGEWVNMSELARYVG